ncbi:allophanate hydrolase 2 subunit 2 [Methylophaga lonarensis MPL]|uniref:Allophanate hydrolase 2 subunit 2 n=1 Tax=Methylophaga lonarensis MPL TaxID=1286106 RepID=M7PHF3_9GAMM|nr:biotin-dependent carboxyltransferase family protein [Methylophaga lonarensis]EMR13300.1 allophanate hydrolase 2 subunit 2 [Methylophaga lonarensis MPL]
MMPTGFKVLKPGMLTLVQDLGRFNYRHIGLSTGGAADEQAYLWANRLLDNRANSPALEICFGGLQLQALTDSQIAITGADMLVTRNNQPLANWQSHAIKSGDTLSFGYAKSGIRTYLAVKGGFQITPSFGSVATVIREKIGGLDGTGSPLKAGDLISCQESKQDIRTRVPSMFVPDYQQPLIVSVIVNQHRHDFSPSEEQKLFHHTYRISAQSNSMGLRLQGEAIKPKVKGIISEGTAFGSIQIPPDGQPIILLKDRQTIGGYPVLGSVFSMDAFLLAQQQAMTELRFTTMTLAEAQRQMRRFYQFFGI